jgi:phage terminase large subunit-like protein
MHSLAQRVATLPDAEQAEVLRELDPDALLYDWRFWARPNQLPPEGDWLTWLILAGRGFGKTRTGAEWVRANVCGPSPLTAGKYRRIALVAETSADARDVMVEGDSGILGVHPKEFRPLYEPSKRRLTWPNGAVATLYNATEPDQLRGPQHDLAWADELAKWALARETWDQLQFGLRLGNHPRVAITTTPRPIPVLREIMADKRTATLRGLTMDNRGNLAASFMEQITAKYAGTRLGRQELNAEILDDVPGALWTRKMIEDQRVREAPEMSRVVIAIDPSGTDGNDEGDDVGIVAAGRGVDGRGYVLGDYTCKLSPEGWARRAITAYHQHEADRIVAERNFGGAMVKSVVRSADGSVPFKEVTASRGKSARAEPISAIYEQGRISHVGGLPELEDELCLMTASGFMGDGSPNRVDAVVWALTEVMLGHQRPEVAVPVTVPKLATGFNRRVA